MSGIRAIILWLLLFTLLTVGAMASFTIRPAEATPWRYTAIKQLEGMHERTHRKALKRRLGVDPAVTPWCGAIVAYAVAKGGDRPVKGKLSARSWERFGTPVSKARIRKGDIVTRYSRYSRSRRHVGIAGDRVKGGAVVCSGNTRGGKVACTVWSLSQIKSVRR